MASSDSDDDDQHVKKLALQVITNRGDKFQYVVEPHTTVQELRTIVQEMGGGGGSSVTTKMSIRGLQLVDDHAKWAHLPLPHASMIDGEKLYVHFSSSAAAEGRNGGNIPQGASSFLFDQAGAPAGASASARKEAESAARARAAMMEPMLDAMVRNPAFVDNLIAMQPELKAMIREHPQVESELRNPETLKQIMMSQIDPDRRRDANRTMQLQLAQLSNIPGGTAMIERYMSKALQQPEGKRTVADLRDALEEHSKPDPTLSSNAAALPNPWDARTAAPAAPPAAFPPSAAYLNSALNPFGGQNFQPQTHSASAQSHPSQSSLQQLFGAMPRALPTQTQPHSFAYVPPQQQDVLATSSPPLDESGDADFSEQLVVLLEMGFEDDEACMRALKVCRGDIDAAVCFLADEADKRNQSGKK